MKNVLIAIVMIALVASLAGGGLFAYFTDTETSNTNTFQAGSIKLAVNGEEVWSGPPVYVDSKPCIWTTLEADTLENTGMNPGRINLSIDVTAWEGGAFPDAESDAGDTDNSCDIQNYVEVIVTDLPQTSPYPTEPDLDMLIPIVQGSADVHIAQAAVEAYDLAHGTTLASHLLYMGLLGAFDEQWKALGTMWPGSIIDLGILVHLKSRGTGNVDNIMQGDKVIFNKSYRLMQFKCGEVPGGGKTQILPPFPTTLNPNPPTSRIRLTYPGPSSYWNATFLSLPAGTYDVQTGVPYKCWCLDEKHTISATTERNVYLMSSLNPEIYSYAIKWGYNPPVENVFNYVNYLINTYEVGQTLPWGGTLTREEMQYASWYFIDGVTYASIPADSQKVVDQVLLNGGTFEPEHGQMALVIVFDASTNVFQVVGIEVDP